MKWQVVATRVATSTCAFFIQKRCQSRNGIIMITVPQSRCIHLSFLSWKYGKLQLKEYLRKDVLSQNSALLLWIEHISKYKEIFFFDADRWILFKHNDEDSFCNKSDADENNTDDIRFVRNEVPKKLTFEMLSETLNKRNYDPVVPQERKICKANVGEYKVLTWTTDKPNVSRK